MISEVRIGAKCQSGFCHEISQVFQDLFSIPAGLAWFSNSFSPVQSQQSTRKDVALSNPQIRPSTNNRSINQSSKRLRTPLCGFCFLGVYACLFAAWDARPDFFTWTWWSTLQVKGGSGHGKSWGTVDIFGLIGGGFNMFFMFIPTWGRFPIWRSYFSEGLVQPPARFGLIVGCQLEMTWMKSKCLPNRCMILLLRWSRSLVDLKGNTECCQRCSPGCSTPSQRPNLCAGFKYVWFFTSKIDEDTVVKLTT